MTRLPFRADPSLLGTSPFFHGDPRDPQVLALWDRGCALARPKAAACRVTVCFSEAGRVTALGDQPMDSPLLDRNLAGQPFAWVYAATCGQELAAWQPEENDAQREALFVLRFQAARFAQEQLIRELRRALAVPYVAAMNPGSLPAWPMAALAPMFRLLGPLGAELGLTMDEESRITPLETTLGLLFAAEQPYSNCMLCRSLECPARQTPFDPAMAAAYGL